MRENRQSGSEGGVARAIPTPIATRQLARLGGALRVTRGSLLLTTGTACRRHEPQEDRILRQDARSWHEGYRAGQLGTQPAACPDSASSTESWSWSSGYIEGKAARQKARKAVKGLDEISEH